MKSLKDQKGLTLTELLVVISIISILTALQLVIYRSGERQIALQSSAQKIALDLRNAQNLALSTAEDKGKIPPGGYGVYFQKDSDFYILFADHDGEGDFDVGVLEEIRYIELEKGVKIKELSESGSEKDWSYVLFTPPDPSIKIGPSDPGPTSLRIALCLEKDCNNLTKDITINKVGKIDIE